VFSILLLITLLLFSGITPPPARADAPAVKRYQTTISYTPSEHGFIYVQVRMDNGRTVGGLTGTFILDIGASIISVTDALAKKMGLSPVPAINTAGGPLLLNGKQAQMVTVPQLYIGSFHLINPSCLVLSQKSLSALFGGPWTVSSVPTY